MDAEKFVKLIIEHTEFYVSEPESGYKHPVLKFEKGRDGWDCYTANGRGWAYHGTYTIGPLFSVLSQRSGAKIWTQFS